MKKILIYSVLLLFVVISLTPFYLATNMSLKNEFEILENPYAFPFPPVYKNFVRAWHTARIGKYMKNTIFMVFPTILICISFSCLAGFSLAKLDISGGKIIFLLIIIGLMIPPHALIIPLYYNLRDLHLLNSRLGLILPLAAVNVPFGTFLMRSFFRSMPKELLDSARIDGCNDWKAFLFIFLPLSTPGVLTLSVFLFMHVWNTLLIPLIVAQREDLRPLSVGLTYFQSRSVDYTGLAAGAIMSLVPILIFYLIFQRYFIRGITMGAVKG